MLTYKIFVQLLSVFRLFSLFCKRMINRNYFQMGAPHITTEEDFMDVDVDPEDAIAMIEAMGEHSSEKLLDTDFVHDFEDDFDDDDLD